MRLGVLQVVMLCFGLLAVPASSVVLQPHDTTSPTLAPGDDFGFSHVGTVGGLSAVYLGRGWVLTANHVVKTESPILVLGDQSYRAVPDSMVRLETRPGLNADLKLFRLEELPGLPALRLSSREPESNEIVTLVGNGWTADTKELHWSADWREIDPALAVYAGYRRGGPGALRWGRNAVTWTGRDIALGRSVTRAFETRFDRTGGPPGEASAVTGDSGGAVFAKRNGRWELVGILFARNTHEGQPSDTIAYGNISQVADLSFYRDQLLDLTRGSEGFRTGLMAASLVVGGLLCAGAVGWVLRRRRAAA